MAQRRKRTTPPLRLTPTAVSEAPVLGATPKLAYQTGPSLIARWLSLLPACPSLIRLASILRDLRGSMGPPFCVGGHLPAGAPPCGRHTSLYSRDPRFGLGSVLAHQHLIGPIHPTRNFWRHWVALPDGSSRPVASRAPASRGSCAKN
jgi:hypothetical protein